MRCLVDKFFWCPILDNEDGDYCYLCRKDTQLDRINFIRKRKGLEQIILPIRSGDL